MCLAADGGEGAPPTSTAERGTRSVGVSTSVGDSVFQLRRAHAGIQVPHVPVVVLDRRTSSSDRSIEQTFQQWLSDPFRDGDIGEPCCACQFATCTHTVYALVLRAALCACNSHQQEAGRSRSRRRCAMLSLPAPAIQAAHRYVAPPI
jgi:hypothetical protein